VKTPRGIDLERWNFLRRKDALTPARSQGTGKMVRGCGGLAGG
jgi:hypothetical protein